MKSTFKLIIALCLIFIFPSIIPAAQQTADKDVKQEETDQMKRKSGEEASKLDEIVVKATKIGKKASQMTDVVTIIGEEEIKQSAITDTTDLLRYTPGIQFKRAGGPGQYVYTKMRGYSDGHFAVLIDGMKINESMSAGTGNFFSKLDPFLLGEIEVLHGPQSALYGADTTAGVMSFITKGGTPGLNLSAGAEYGTYDWKKGAAGVRGTAGAFRYAGNIVGVESGGIHLHEDFRNVSPQFKLGWGKEDVFDAELSFINITSKWNYTRLLEPNDVLTSKNQLWAFQVPDSERYNEEKYNLATLNLRHQINDQFRQKLMLGWYRKKTEGNNPNNGLLGYITAPTNNFTVNYIDYYSKGQTVPVYDDGDGKPSYFQNDNKQVDYNLIWDRQGSGWKNTALVGFNWMEQKGKKWGKYGENDGSQATKGIYFHDQLLLADDALVIDGGIRYDDNKEFENKVTWKIGTSYTVKPTNTTFFTNYGTSFRQPTITHLYDPKYGNKDLKPEEGWMVQGGIRQQFLDGKIQLETAAWYSELKNVISFYYTTPRDGYYINRDRQETQGITFDFRWYFFPNFLLLGNYTYTESHSEAAGVSFRTVQISRNSGTLGLEYNQDEKLFLGVYGYYQGPRLRWKGDVELDGYFRCDVAGRYNLGKGFSAYTRINNLLNDKHSEDPYESPGLNFIAGLSWDF